MLVSFVLAVSVLQLHQGARASLQSGVDRMRKDMSKIHSDMMNLPDLTTVYNEFIDQERVKISKIAPRKIIQEVSNRISDQLQNEIEALKMAVKFAETQSNQYPWNATVQEDLTYLNAKLIEWDDERMEYSSIYGQKIVKNESTVHIPTEIYEKDEKILKGIDFSSRLDQVFIKNSKKLKYQFFASGDGFMRIFPGMKWRNEGLDTYDVRRRPWYVEGSSSPKDVMMLIDTSGSMQGQSLKLMQMAVKRLIATLGENDFVGVAQFPGQFLTSVDANGMPFKWYPHFLVDAGKDLNTTCFKSFVQANQRNIDRIFHQIDKLKAKGIARLEQAVEFAFYSFQQFDQDHSSNQGADCNRIILIVTDGGSAYPKEAIERFYKKYPVLENVRIFTYSVGEHNSYNDVLRKMACDNRGHFSHIPAVAAVSSIIQTYLREVHHHASTESDVAVKDRKAQMTVHRTLPEKYLSEWHQEMGQMTSLTLPVFNRTGNQSLLGLMGTDVTVGDMMNLIPLEQLGPNGYALAININGYLIFHPALKHQPGKVRNPPNIDFLEVESQSVEKEEVRRNLIDMGAREKSGVEEAVIADDYVNVDDDIHVHKQKRTFVYTTLPHSPFGMALVIPIQNTHYLEILSDDFDLRMNTTRLFQIVRRDTDDVEFNLTTDQFGLLLSEKMEYCSFNVSRDAYFKKSAQQEEQMSNQTSNATTASADPEGDLFDSIPPGMDAFTFEVLESVAADLSSCLRASRCGMETCKPYDTLRYRVSKLLLDLLVTGNYMQRNVGMWEEKIKRKDVVSVFVTTTSGVTRVYPQSALSKYQKFADVPTSPLYSRAFLMEGKLVFTTKYRPGKIHWGSAHITRDAYDNVFIFKGVATSPGDEYRFAVAGMEVRQQRLHAIFKQNNLCLSKHLCYLLDDGGYVVATYPSVLQFKVGFFFGYIESNIMHLLINRSVFEVVETYDFQALCETEEADSRGGLSWTKTYFVSIAELLQSFMAYLYLILQFLLHMFCIAPAEEHIPDEEPKPPQLYSCITLSHKYMMIANGRFEERIDCNGCMANITAIPVEGTNLLLVAASEGCVCKGDNYPERDAKQDSGPSLCEQASSPRYRQRPKQCYHYQAEEGRRCLGCPTLSNVFLIVSLNIFAMYRCLK